MAGYGRASVQRLMTPWALVRVGSVSKVVTSVAVMKLVEDDRLQLSSRVFGTAGDLYCVLLLSALQRYDLILHRKTCLMLEIIKLIVFQRIVQ